MTLDQDKLEPLSLESFFCGWCDIFEEWLETRKVEALAAKIWIEWKERPAGDKHSSLLYLEVSEESKKPLTRGLHYTTLRTGNLQ